MPTGPWNGSIVSISSTLVGAEIFFMCAPGFVPAGRMRANCTSDGITVDGTWTPDPATLMCNGEMIRQQELDEVHLQAILCSLRWGPQKSLLPLIISCQIE